MKKIAFSSLMFLSIFLFFSCSKDNEESNIEDAVETILIADFDYSIDASKVPAELTLTNKSSGATSYSWYFNSGIPSESKEETPGLVTYNNSGDYEVTLIASNDKETKTIKKTIRVDLANNLIITYENIKLGGQNLQGTVGSLFSTEKGRVYKSSDLTSDNGLYIDIAYVGTDGLMFFESPTKVHDWGLTKILNATAVDFINFIEGTNIEFTATMFDEMKDDSLLRDLNITTDNESFSVDTPRIVLFENSKGKKGVIKLKEIISGNSGYVIFDLKVQK